MEIKNLRKKKEKDINKHDIVPIYHGSMLTRASTKIPNLDPSRVKAMIFWESDGGITGITDIMQSNVTLDWDKCKTKDGLRGYGFKDRIREKYDTGGWTIDE